MKNLKSILPWVGLILVVGGYLVRNEVRWTKFENYQGLKDRQELHWVMHMRQWERMRQFHPDMEPWSEHIAACWLTMEKPR